jgi:hypothetical protein
MDSEVAAPSLLALPDACLLAVLQCCAADSHHTLFSAARAHSRLHQAAVVALHSIVAVVRDQQHLHSVMSYLGKYGQHVDRIRLKGPNSYGTVILRQLPPSLHLSSLQVERMGMWLHPTDGYEGVLGAAGLAALKQLRFSNCSLLGNFGQIAVALAQLPASLEHLSITAPFFTGNMPQFPARMLEQLQQLTYLELAYPNLPTPGQGELFLQPLQAMTRLVDLRLTGWVQCTISDTMLRNAHGLARLELSVCTVEAGALAGKSRLQHLNLSDCFIPGGGAGPAQLLAELQNLQQLTHLCFVQSVGGAWEAASLPATAYSALTACSKLRHLNVSFHVLPVGVWQQVFSAGRQLPYLQSLVVSCVAHPSTIDASALFPAPEGSRLVSCCPGLQSLRMQRLHLSAALLSPLQGLSELHTLHLSTPNGAAAADSLQAVCQLTRLRELYVSCPIGRASILQEGVLLQLTHLQQLTALGYGEFIGRGEKGVIVKAEVSAASVPSLLACLLACTLCQGSTVMCVLLNVAQGAAKHEMASKTLLRAGWYATHQHGYTWHEGPS